MEFPVFFIFFKFFLKKNKKNALGPNFGPQNEEKGLIVAPPPPHRSERIYTHGFHVYAQKFIGENAFLGGLVT